MNENHKIAITQTLEKRKDITHVYVYDDGAGYFFDAQRAAKHATKGVQQLSRADVLAAADSSQLTVSSEKDAKPQNVSQMNKAQLTTALTELQGEAPDAKLTVPQLKELLIAAQQEQGRHQDKKEETPDV